MIRRLLATALAVAALVAPAVPALAAAPGLERATAVSRATPKLQAYVIERQDDPDFPGNNPQAGIDPTLPADPGLP